MEKQNRHLKLVHSQEHTAEDPDARPGQPILIGHDYLKENPITEEYPDVVTSSGEKRAELSEPKYLTPEQHQAAQDLQELLAKQR